MTNPRYEVTIFLRDGPCPFFYWCFTLTEAMRVYGSVDPSHDAITQVILSKDGVQRRWKYVDDVQAHHGSYDPSDDADLDEVM